MLGAYDGAEVCELVWIFILYQLSRKYNKNNIGLYRDDGLAVFKNISGPQEEKIKKHFQNIFRRNNSNIIVKCNLKKVNYLDVTLNLSDGSSKPFHKPNSEINYIYRESNHPPSIIKQLPLSVESRLSKLSSDKNVFTQAASVYQEALKRAGYNHKLKYKNSDRYNSNNNNNQDNCNSNDTKNDNNYNNNKFKSNHDDNWYNNDDNNNKDNFDSYENKDSNDNNNNKVEFNINVNRGNNNNNNNYNSNSNDNRDKIKNKDTTTAATNNCFNRNNIKVSYSCMPNIKWAINSHNRKILHPPVNNQTRTCNCIRLPFLYKKNAWAKIHYIKQILVQKTVKQKFITAYQKQNLKQDIRTMKNSSTAKSTKMTRNYRLNSGQLKLQKKSQS